MFITLSSVQKIENISFAISIVVICLLFITLVSLFAIYFNYYKKCIDNELEDQNINKDVHLENKSYFKNNDEFINNVHLSKREKYDTFYSISNHAEKTKKKHSFFRAIFNVILFIFALVFIGIMATSIYVRCQGDLFYLGDTAYVVIQTGSMEEKNENNTYLFDNNLDDQIAPMSLIGVTPIESEDDLSQYDIVGYYNDNDQLSPSMCGSDFSGACTDTTYSNIRYIYSTISQDAQTNEETLTISGIQDSQETQYIFKLDANKIYSSDSETTTLPQPEGGEPGPGPDPGPGPEPSDCVSLSFDGNNKAQHEVTKEAQCFDTGSSDTGFLIYGENIKISTSSEGPWTADAIASTSQKTYVKTSGETNTATFYRLPIEKSQESSEPGMGSMKIEQFVVTTTNWDSTLTITNDGNSMSVQQAIILNPGLFDISATSDNQMFKLISEDNKVIDSLKDQEYLIVAPGMPSEVEGKKRISREEDGGESFTATITVSVKGKAENPLPVNIVYKLKGESGEIISPESQGVPSDTPTPPDDGGLSGGAIAAIVIAVIVVVGVAGFCVYWFFFRKHDDIEDAEVDVDAEAGIEA